MRSATLIAYLAAEHRKTKRNPERIAELRKQIREAQIEEWAERQLAVFPPLSPATRDRLALLLNSGAGHEC